MKNISKIILGAAALLSVAACQNKAEFKSYPFARLQTYSYTVEETAGTLNIPVTINAEGGSLNTAITFEVISDSAVEGTDFTVSPAGGVLNFSGNDTENIVITIADQSGVFTGNKSFTVNLTGATNGYTIGAYYSASVTIKDLDDPRSAFLGTFTADATDYWGQAGAVIDIVVDPDDDTYSKLLVGNMCYPLVVYGITMSNGFNILSATMNEERTAISIPCGQVVLENYGPIILVTYGADGASMDGALTLSLDAEGNLVPDSGFGFYELDDEHGGWWYLFLNPPTFRP